jgi:protein TonB
MLVPAHGKTMPRLSRAGLAFVVLMHALLFWALLQMDAIRLPSPLAVLTADLIKPPEEIKPPEPPPPKPRPLEKRPEPRPVQPPVQLAAPEESPAPPTLAVPPAPTFVETLPPIQAPPAPPAPAAPAATVQPRFDADYLHNPKPVYPPLARRMGEEGRVVLRVHVRADGGAGEVLLHTSSGSPRLDQSAVDTVRRWRFVPARRGDESVAAWVLVPIVFSLKE